MSKGHYAYWVMDTAAVVAEALDAKIVNRYVSGATPARVIDARYADGRGVQIEWRHSEPVNGEEITDIAQAVASPVQFRGPDGQVHVARLRPSERLTNTELGWPPSAAGREPYVDSVDAVGRDSAPMRIFVCPTTEHLVKVTRHRLNLTDEKVKKLVLGPMEVLRDLEEVTSWIAQLSRAQRRALRLRCGQLTNDQVARRLFTTVAAIENLLARAAIAAADGSVRTLLRKAQAIGMTGPGCPPGGCQCDDKRADVRLPECPSIGVLHLTLEPRQ
ncbi:MAG: hypothetical protein ACYDH6_23465 [Acidimicrobiales bacterium]